jgi:hypothetical protein
MEMRIHANQPLLHRAVRQAYSAARSSVTLAAFCQGMVSGKGWLPGRTPLRIILKTAPG